MGWTSRFGGGSLQGATLSNGRGHFLALLGLVAHLLPDVFLPNGDNHIRIWASPGGAPSREVLVAHVDVVPRILEPYGLAPGSELGSRLLPCGVNVRSGAPTGAHDLAPLAERGKEHLLLPLDHLSCGQAAWHRAEFLARHSSWGVSHRWI